MALDANLPLLALPQGLSPSAYEYIEVQPVFDVDDGSMRFLPRVVGHSRVRFSQLGAGDAALGSPIDLSGFVFLNAAPSGLSSGPELLCDCPALAPGEFLIHETPVKNSAGRYLSVNDESYKAIHELINYPYQTPALIAVAFSELAYVYNALAIERFLDNKGFSLLAHRGFMNSVDYPGFRDSQYFVASGPQSLYVSIRGTSGAADLETTLDADLIEMAGAGAAHGGYLSVANAVDAQIRTLLTGTKQPIVVTGHSLGGSVALLLTMILADAGISVLNLNYAPVPVVNSAAKQHYQDVISTTNYFLPDEEVSSLDDRQNWLQLLGDRILLPDVGTTAGAVHFVINYLKSQMVAHGMSTLTYEQGMPDCVLVKYACFAGPAVRLIAPCAFTQDRCLSTQRNLLTGFAGLPVPLSDEQIEYRLGVTAKNLVRNLDDAHAKQAYQYRLAWLFMLAGRMDESQRLLNELASESPQEFHREQGFHGEIWGVINR